MNDEIAAVYIHVGKLALVLLLTLAMGLLSGAVEVDFAVDLVRW